MDFAHRYGYKKLRETLQLDTIDKTLKTKLWNLITRYFIYKFDSMEENYESDHWIACKHIWTEFLDKDIDDIHPYRSTFGVSFFEDVKSIYNSMEWYDIYVFIENLAQLDLPQLGFSGDFCNQVNKILEKEQSGYRFVEGKILKITSEEEIESIESAIELDETGLISNHLATALKLLSNKERPDYRNSMKESILAVEAICSKIANKPKASLGDALNILEKEHNLHTALKLSYSSLYGYTSDAGGIRHKLKDGDQEVQYEDALYMLVTCSAFINYLKSKYQN